jgi:hypothetical protein
MAPAVDESTGRRAGGGIAAHHDIDVAAVRSRSGSKTALQAAPACCPGGTLENQWFSRHPPENVLF